MISAATLHRHPRLRNAGLSHRSSRCGVEYDLVRRFVSSLPTPRKGQERQVFVEPRLESGFPDLVVVYWNTNVVRQWKAPRDHLRPLDLRVLHCLSLSGPMRREQLSVFFPERLTGALRRLHEADLIRERNEGWMALSLKSIFAIRRLIAIEAKVADWRTGLDQAVRNTWFASESYLLLPDGRTRPLLLAEALRFGVGLVTPARTLRSPLVPATRSSLPKSHASWMFNEWIWRS